MSPQYQVMGITISGGGFEGMFDEILRDAMARAEVKFAESLANQARENGLSTADDIKIDAKVEGDDSGIEIDVERVRMLANQMLESDES